MDKRRSFGRFRRFPEPFSLIPGSHCCFTFSQISSGECCLEFCREWLGGQRLISSMAWSSRSVASQCGPSSGRGRRAVFVGWLWMLSTASQSMLHTRYRCSGRLWLQWVVRSPLLRFLAGRMCWQTLTRRTWEVGTHASWWSIQFLTCVSSSAVCRRCLLPSSGLWIPSQWRNSLSRD